MKSKITTLKDQLVSSVDYEVCYNLRDTINDAYYDYIWSKIGIDVWINICSSINKPVLDDLNNKENGNER